MKRLRIVFRGGAIVEVDLGDEWFLDTDLMKFPPPSDMWTDRLRYVSAGDIVAIIELRPAVAE